MRFDRDAGPAAAPSATGGQPDGSPGTLGSGGSTQVAIRMEEEIERRSRKLVEQIQADAQRAGFDHGVEAARTEIGPLLAALTEATGAVAGSTEAALDDLARASVRIGLAVAESVIGRELRIDPTVFVDPVRRAVHALDGDDDVVIHLHPADAAVLRELEDRELDGFRIADDHSLARGQCRVESAIRIALDGIDERLDHIRTTLAQAVDEPLDATDGKAS